jgi:hypothetical protein
VVDDHRGRGRREAEIVDGDRPQPGRRQRRDVRRRERGAVDDDRVDAARAGHRDRRGGVGRAAAVGGHRQRGEVPRREHRQGRRWIAADHQRRRAAGVDRGLGERGQPQRVAAAEPVAGVGAQQQPRRDHATCSSSQRVSSTPSRGSAWSLE